MWIMEGILTISHIGLWVAVISEGIVLLALIQQVGVLLLRMGPRGPLNVSVAGGPETGRPAPDIGSDVDGRPVSLVVDGAGGGDGVQGTVVVFASPTCGSCTLVPGAVSALARSYGELRFCVIASGDARLVGGYRRQFPGQVQVVADDGRLTSAYSVTDLPYAVFVDGAGVVRQKGIVNNREHLEELVVKALAWERHRRRHGGGDGRPEEREVTVPSGLGEREASGA